MRNRKMMKMYVATGWEETEKRLYVKKENAIKDFNEMILEAKVNPMLELMDIEAEWDETNPDDIFLIATAFDHERKDVCFASVELLEVEDL